VSIINAYPPSTEIRQVSGPDEIAAARDLFREYEAWLGLDLCFQGFEDELAQLPGKYADPGGRLLLAHSGETIAGCVALRKLEAQGVCEMKRLFVRPGFRALGIGRSLVDRVIAEARKIGYQRMRLDTYPAKMGKAVDLYRTYGFVEIEPYYDNPHPGVLFMELDL
jgi:putative acetyltransferase